MVFAALITPALASSNATAYVGPIVSLGNLHTCAVNENATLVCWGVNLNSQFETGDTLGDGSPYSVHLNPSEAFGGVDLGTVKQVSAGTYHTFVLFQNGTLMCAGHNRDGSCGGGFVSTVSPFAQPDPITVAGLGGPVVQVTATHYGGCALMVTGDVKCWGRNDDREVGTGDAASPVVTPTAVLGIDEIVMELFQGLTNTCVRLGNSPLTCWAGGGTMPVSSVMAVPCPTAVSIPPP